MVLGESFLMRMALEDDMVAVGEVGTSPKVGRKSPKKLEKLKFKSFNDGNIALIDG